jgi:hypothetical protein
VVRVMELVVDLILFAIAGAAIVLIVKITEFSEAISGAEQVSS